MSIFPIRDFVADTPFFAMKTGGYGILFELSGIDAEGLCRAQLDEISQTIAKSRRILTEDVWLYEYLVSRRVRPQQPEGHEDAVIFEMQQDRKEFLEQTAYFKSSRLYLALYIKGTKFKNQEVAEKRAATKHLLRKFHAIAVLVEKTLGTACVVRACLPSETVEFFSYLLNLEDHLTATRVPRSNIAKRLMRCPITHDRDNDYMRIGHRYVQMMSMFGRPIGTRPNMWGALQGINCEYVACQIWHPKPNRRVRKLVSQQETSQNLGSISAGAIMSALMPSQNHSTPVSTASDRALSKGKDKLGDVLVTLDDGNLYGEFSFFLLMHAPELAEIRAAAADVNTILTQPSEASVIEESAGNLSAYLSIFPGRDANNVRKVLLSDRHASDLALVFRPFEGHVWDDDLNVPSMMLFQTLLNAPFRLKRTYRGNGNTFVIGGPRRGKSLNVNAQVQHEAAYGGHVFILDVGGSYDFTAQMLGGVASKVGIDGPKHNPFSLAPTKRNMAAIVLLIKRMVEMGGGEVRAEQEHDLYKVVQKIYTAPEEFRKLSQLRKWVDDQRIASGLALWTGDGIYAHAFDNLTDEFSFNRIQAIDYAGISDKTHPKLLEMYLYWHMYLISEVCNDQQNLGVPKTIVAEEIWKHIKSPQMVDFLLDAMKAQPKNMGRLIVITHLVTDLGPIAGAIKNACPVTIFLGGGFTDEDTVFFKLNPAELEAVRGLAMRQLAIKVEGDSQDGGFFKVLELNLDRKGYARATTSPAERALRLQLTQQYGMHKAIEMFEEANKNRRMLAAAGSN